MDATSEIGNNVSHVTVKHHGTISKRIPAMNKREKLLIVLLRLNAVIMFSALPAVFMPFSMMETIHGYLGMGELPREPIVEYLARSLSMFYTLFGAWTWLLSRDIRRYAPLVRAWCYAYLCLGAVTLWIDIVSGVPESWTWLEGPSVFLNGLLALWLSRGISTPETHYAET